MGDTQFVITQHFPETIPDLPESINPDLYHSFTSAKQDRKMSQSKQLSSKSSLQDRTLTSTRGLEQVTKAIREQNMQDLENLHPLKNKEADIPELQAYIKLTTFKPGDFHYRWSLLIFICNIYNLFSVPFWISIEGFPDDIWLGVEIGVEIILIVDMLLRIFFMRTDQWQKLWMLHEDGLWWIIASSLPYSIFIKAVLSNFVSLNSWWVGLISIPKLLRYKQINTFFSNQELINKSGRLSFFHYLEIMVKVLGTTHYMAMLFMIVTFYERLLGERETWYDYWEHWRLGYLERYIDITYWATCTMASNGYGDIIPVMST